MVSDSQANSGLQIFFTRKLLCACTPVYFSFHQTDNITEILTGCAQALHCSMPIHISVTFLGEASRGFLDHDRVVVANCSFSFCCCCFVCLFFKDFLHNLLTLLLPCPVLMHNLFTAKKKKKDLLWFSEGN